MPGQYPDLFKYRSIGSDLARGALQEAIENNRLFWQSPRSFNDPFDSLPYFVFGQNVNDRARYARNLVGRRVPNQPRAERRTVEKRILGISPQRMRYLGAKAVGEMAVTCFSTMPDSMLMWAHYAENHSGVCLQFKQTPEQGFIAFPVAYSDDRPAADITKMTEENHLFFQQAALTKAKCWEYETEYRMVVGATPPGFRVFPPSALTGIILGAKISEGDSQWVADLLAVNRPDLTLRRAEIDARHYRLNLLEI